jgi:hypothetical protein
MDSAIDIPQGDQAEDQPAAKAPMQSAVASDTPNARSKPTLAKSVVAAKTYELRSHATRSVGLERPTWSESSDATLTY